MRRRLTLTTVAAAAVAVIVLGVPLAVAVRSLIYDLSLRALERDAEGVAALIEQRGNEFLVIAAGFAQATGSEIALVGPEGRVRAFTAGFDRRSVDATGPADSFLAGGTMRVVVPVTVLGESLLLYVDAPSEPVQVRVRQAWLSIAVVSGTALLVAAAVGSWQARTLSRPLEDLARGARRLGDGDFSARAPRSGLPEPDMVAVALDSTAERLGVLVERANSFSADASHQLRTPLTALRLNLEAMQYAPDNGDLVDDALMELDRLDATISELLTLASPGATERTFDAADLVAERLQAWAVIAESDGREVRFEPPAAPPLVRARPAAVGQALQVLLDNALGHGAGTITVSVAATYADDPRWVRICVADEGPGFDEARLPPPTRADRGDGGRGLPLARSLMAAEGGLLRVEKPTSVGSAERRGQPPADPSPPAAGRAGARVCLLVPAAPAGGREHDRTGAARRGAPAE